MIKRTIVVFPDLEALSRWSAGHLVEAASTAIAGRGQFLIALNGGTTPVRLFQLLASDYRTGLDWNRTHVFWGDERCVPARDSESCFGQAQQLFLNQVSLPEGNIHPINGELPPDEAAREYTLLLMRFAAAPLEWPRFDLVLLGVGEDGHTASLFPGSPVEADRPVLSVTGHYQDRPAQRITLTPPVFNSAREIWVMAAGGNKADILSQVLGNVSRPDRYPIQRIQPQDGKIIWLVDQAAARSIPA